MLPQTLHQFENYGHSTVFHNSGNKDETTMQPTNTLTVRCEQCDDLVDIPSGSPGEVKAFLAQQGWEPHGIHISIAIAAAGHADGRYACGRCSREVTAERFDRLANQVLREFPSEPSYDLIYRGGQSTLKVYDRGWQIPLVAHGNDEQTRVALRQAIRNLSVLDTTTT